MNKITSCTLNPTITDLFGRIVESNGKEFEKYRALSWEEKQLIIAEVLLRLLRQLIREVLFVSDERIPVTRVKNNSLKYAQKDSKGNLLFEVEFSAKFDIMNEEFSLYQIDDVLVSDTLEKELYEQKINDMEEMVGELLSYDLKEVNFLETLFDVLHQKQLTICCGSEAVDMYYVYKQACKHYPSFAICKYQDKIDIMRQGYYKAMTRVKRDSWIFARYCFQALVENRKIRQLRKYDDVIGRYVCFEEVTEQWRDGRLNWVLYEGYYAKSNGTYKTAILTSDLWTLLRSQKGSEIKESA